MRNRIASGLGWAVFVALSGFGSVSLAAEAGEPRRYEIPAQAAEDGLVQLARQSSLPLVYTPEVTRGIRTNAISGTYTPREALTRLLADTGLEAVETPAGGTAIRPSGDAGPATTRGAVLLEEIVVTGSRLKRTTGDGPAPVVTLDAQALARSGAATVTQALRQVSQATLVNDESGVNTFLGAQTVQLRGLNLGSTLVLVNGRRVSVSSAQVNNNIFDLNALPLEAVERIEVLTSSGSAVYGADAIAGVVNVLLKQDVEGVSVAARYGTTDAGGGREVSLSATTGLQWSTGRASLILSGLDRQAVLGFDRELVANNDYTRFGSLDRRPDVANPASIYALAPPAPGRPPSQIPLRVERTSVGAFQSLVPQSRRAGAFLAAEQSLGERVELFGEALASNNRQTVQSSPDFLLPGDQIVGPSSPINTFGRPLTFSYLATGLGPTENETDSTFYRVIVGSRIRWAGNWEAEIALGQNGDRTHTDKRNFLDFSPAGSARIAAALAAGSFNPFVAGPGGTPEFLESIRFSPRDRGRSKERTVDGQVRGAAFDLPGGPAQVVVGGEYRREDIDALNIETFSRTANRFVADRTVWAAFVEVGLPVVGPGNRRVGLEALDLTLAARHDDYSDFGSATSPQAGLAWRPVTPLLVRASWGEAFKAPSLFQLYRPRTVTRTLITNDPRNPGVRQTNVLLTQGGNLALDPETARSWGAGLAYEDRFGETRVSASVDYWVIEQDQRVQRFNGNTLLLNEAAFPGRIGRDATTTLITSIDATNANFGRVALRGVDLSLRLQVPTAIGEFTPSIAATRALRYDASLVPGAPAVDQVGVASLEGFAPDWRWSGGLAWSAGPWSASAIVRHTSGYRDYVQPGAPVRDVEPYTTADVGAAYRLENAGFLKGLQIRVGVVNAFDETPPFSQRSFNLGYDPAIADIRGRFYHVGVDASF